MTNLITDSVVLGADPIPYVLQFKLWSQTKVEDPNRFYASCWNFQGLTTEFGHGEFSHRKKKYLAHRVAYSLATGAALSPTDVVRHKCDNPRCCNPLHLETGTVLDNNLDMLARGRNPKGESHGMSTIDEHTVREIRWLYHVADGVLGSIRAISKRLGVAKHIVAEVASRRSWKEVEDDFTNLWPKPEPLSDAELKITWTVPNRGGSNLTPEKVQRIRAFREAGAPLPMISSAVGGLAWSAISNICNRLSWQDVPQPPMVEVLTAEEIEEAATAKAATAHHGENHHNSRLTPVQVREIRWQAQEYAKQHASTYGMQRALAKRYNMTAAMANQVLSRRTWEELPDDFDALLPKPEPLSFIARAGTTAPRAALSATQIREIRWLAAQSPRRGALAVIAARYNTTKENVSQIARRLTWKEVPDDFETLDPKPAPLA